LPPWATFVPAINKNELLNLLLHFLSSEDYSKKEDKLLIFFFVVNSLGTYRIGAKMDQFHVKVKQ
jgi:hypothetical protein